MSADSDVNPYPHLGFDPAPGVPADVVEVVVAVEAASATITETNDLLGGLRDATGMQWKGKTADAFRAHLDSSLISNLDRARRSLSAASSVLQDWHRSLTGFRDIAAGLDRAMATAERNHQQAVAELARARANPDLGLRGRTFPPAELPVIEQRVDTAEEAVTVAIGAVRDSEDTVAAILRRAHDLAEECERVARRDAARLTDAAAHVDHNFLDSLDHLMWDVYKLAAFDPEFLSAHAKSLHDGLSSLSKGAALLGMVVPPPFDVGLEVVAGAATVGAFAMDGYDPELRRDVTDVVDDVARGHVSMRDAEEAWHIGHTVVSDGLGALEVIKPGSLLEKPFVIRQLDKVVPESIVRKVGSLGEDTSDAERLDALTRAVRAGREKYTALKNIKDLLF